MTLLSPLLLSPPITWWGTASLWEGAAPLGLPPSAPAELSTQTSMVKQIPARWNGIQTWLSLLHIWPWRSTSPFVWDEPGVYLEALHIDGLPGLIRGAQTPSH